MLNRYLTKVAGIIYSQSLQQFIMLASWLSLIVQMPSSDIPLAHMALSIYIGFPKCYSSLFWVSKSAKKIWYTFPFCIIIFFIIIFRQSNVAQTSSKKVLPRYQSPVTCCLGSANIFSCTKLYPLKQSSSSGAPLSQRVRFEHFNFWLQYKIVYILHGTIQISSCESGSSPID